MSLREEAAAFVREILENTDDFGQVITVTSPNGAEAELRGFVNDIAASIDPGTGLIVSQRKVTVTLPMGALQDAFGALPVGEADAGRFPWVVGFKNRAGRNSRWKVKETLPDQTLGTFVCVLEPWAG